jgi:hypothetical protein
MAEYAVIIPQKNKALKKIIKKSQSAYMIKYLRTHITAFVRSQFPDATNIDYQYVHSKNKNQHCGNCYGCDCYDFKVLEIFFNTAVKSEVRTSIFQKIPHVNLRIVRSKIKSPIKIIEDGIVVKDFPADSYDNSIKIICYRYKVHTIIQNKLIPDTYLSARELSWISEKCIKLGSFSDRSHHDDVIATIHFDTLDSETTITDERNPHMLIKAPSQLLRKIREKPVIWVDKVVILILTANRFRRESILSQIPVDIARIIARKVYSMLDTWFLPNTLCL